MGNAEFSIVSLKSREAEMMLNKVLLVGLISLGGISLSYAQSLELSKQYSTCMDKSGGVMTKMNACISTEIKLQDARLNKSYQSLSNSLTSTRKKQLQEVQRTWIKYRDQNCNFYVDPDGGSLARVSGGICLMEMTASRATELESLSR